MVVVEDLDESLQLGALLDASLAHPLGDFARIAVDTGYQSMAVGFLRAAIIMILDR